MEPGTPPLQSIRLLDQVRERIRYLQNRSGHEERIAFLIDAIIRNATFSHAL